MVMADNEILAKYNKSENKRQCIQILADLNGTTTKEMTAHLEKLGVPVPKRGKTAEEVVVGTSLNALIGTLSALAVDHPNALVCIGGGILTSVVVTSRFGADGKLMNTEVRLEAGKGKNA